LANLPAAAVKRLLSESGGGRGTSWAAGDSGVAAAKNELERLAEAASAAAAKGRRKTIMDGDIERAREQLGI